jgi:hypothetical protein
LKKALIAFLRRAPDKARHRSKNDFNDEKKLFGQVSTFGRRRDAKTSTG